MKEEKPTKFIRVNKLPDEGIALEYDEIKTCIICDRAGIYLFKEHQGICYFCIKGLGEFLLVKI